MRTDSHRPDEEAESRRGLPAVAVVTRTRDRALFLTRAARSVSQQTFRDFIWVVVNDGGDAAAVHASVAQAGLPAERLRVIDLATSVGMEAAANAGVAAVESRYLVLHDDDDTWAPGFLAETVGFLDSQAGARFAGVVTRTMYVSEEVRDGVVIEHARGPYDPDLASIALADLLRHNLFPPISFLVRREIWSRVGGYDASFAVLGDWYFNAMVLFEADIAVLPKTLANWHHRDRGSAGGAAANSVIGAADAHAAAVTHLRNRLAREIGPRFGADGVPLLARLLEPASGGGPPSRQRAGVAAVGRVQLMLEPAGQPSAEPGDNSCLSMALRAMVDLADRRWIAAHLPIGARLRLAAARLLFTAERRGRVGDRDPTWAMLEPLLGSWRLPIPPDFDEASYLAANRDIATAVDEGRLASGYMHWVRHGRREGRLRPLRIAPDEWAVAAARR